MKNYIVTSLNKELLNEYAHNFLETYLRYNIPADLYVYVEDDVSNYSEYSNSSIKFINLFEQDAECEAFVKRHAKKQAVNYKVDAVRFCYKVFAQYLGAKNSGRRMYWIDADCVFVKPIPEKWFEEVLNNSMVAFFDRPNFYSECGFIGYDTQHPECYNFLNEFRRLYVSDDIFNFKEYHDSYIFDRVRDWASVSLWNSAYSTSTNYSETKLGNPEGDLHIMARDPQVSPYIDHKKGPRKSQEHSPEWVKFMGELRQGPPTSGQ
mgnify:CR=1 FL=1|jgi:hypothetical protein|tara:strand:- start:654 stop:1445 length:792 start_codon:yes stop_codon:yes gene_type:complete